MNRLLLLFHSVVFSALAMASDGPQGRESVEEAVKIAMNGTLSPDHVGPDKAARLQTLLTANAKIANSIALRLLNLASPNTRPEDLAAVLVINYTKSDTSGAVQVIRKYLTLLDSAEAAERGRHTALSNDPTEDERFRNRLNRIEQVRRESRAFLTSVGQ
jgi:hypothetical protein